MSSEVLKFPALSGTGRDRFTVKVDLKVRAEYSDERLSECEIDALCPVLPELVSELLMMALDNDRE